MSFYYARLYFFWMSETAGIIGMGSILIMTESLITNKTIYSYPKNDNRLPLNEIINGDCRSVLESFSPNTVDLVVTSPPYADNRSKTYGGISPNLYVD